LKNIPVNTVLLKTLLDVFNQYTSIGGILKIIRKFINNKSVTGLSTIYESIWSFYISDSEKHTTNSTIKSAIKHIVTIATYMLMSV